MGLDLGHWVKGAMSIPLNSAEMVTGSNIGDKCLARYVALTQPVDLSAKAKGLVRTLAKNERQQRRIQKYRQHAYTANLRPLLVLPAPALL